MSIALGPGQIIAGRYRIEQLLGEGGMGSVYRALQLPEERSVALKLLVNEHLGGAVLERFEREVRALGRLVHPNTVRLLDSGRSERGDPFLVMELLEGADLAEDLGRIGPMRWDHALRVCREVLGSLAEAHDAGIVHRDIKPANIYLCAGSSWPRVKVLDFGIAGAAESGARTRRLTLTGTVIGSAAYMSPEQAQGKPVAPATDLYALGAVLFEMLTGKPPFDGLVFTAQLLAKVMQPAPGLRAVCPGLEVPAALHALVAELLERDPAKRPASARQLAERIDGLLDAAPLPPLTRAASAAEPRPALTTPGAPKTQAMLPPTVDQGWAPPRTESAESLHQRARPQGMLRLALAAPVPLAALFVWWTLRPVPVGPEQALGALQAPSQSWPASARELDAAPPSELPPPTGAGPPEPGAGSERPAETSTSAPGVTRVSGEEETSGGSERRELAALEPSRPRVFELPVPEGIGPRGSISAAPMRPASEAAGTSSRPPGASGTPQQPPAVAASAERAANVAAAVRAERAGEITPLQRNDIVAELRRQRYDARSRAAADYRRGRIDRQELKARQRAIERRYEGR
jgi:serine/threonine protein kinase